MIHAPAIAAFPPLDTFYDLNPATESDDDETFDCLDVHEIVTVAEDLLLVKHRCFHPELPMPDIAAKINKECDLDKDAQDLELRFQVFQTPPYRALFVLYIRAISMNVDARYSGGAYAILPAYHALLQSTRTTCETRLFQLIYDDNKFQNETTETIAVEISGRNFPKYSRIISKAQIARCSKVVFDLFHGGDGEVQVSPNQAFTLHGASTPAEKLYFTDAVPYYDFTSVHNHLEQPIFDRLMMFAKDVNVMERLVLLRRQQHESNYKKQESTHQIQTLFTLQYQQHSQNLETMKIAELEQVKEALEAQLTKDIEHIRRMHEALLNHEQAKIEAKYQQKISVLRDRSNEMKHDVLALQRACNKNSWQGLERDLMQTTLHVERIFGTSDYLLRLFILAEDLDANPLRSAITQYLSRPGMFPQFALRREITSKLIPETTVLSILKSIPTEDLREIVAYGPKFFQHELAEREMHTRHVRLSRYLSSLTNEQLRVALRFSTDKRMMAAEHAPEDDALIHGGGSEFMSQEAMLQLEAAVDFPEILEQEFHRRRVFTYVKMNSTGMERDVSFSEDDCLLQLETAHRYCTVLATKECRHEESGKWMFEVTIDTFGSDGESLFVGWEVPRHAAATSTVRSSSPTAKATSSSNASSQNVQLVPGLSPSSDGASYGVTWQSDSGLDVGLLHANGVSSTVSPCFRAGDVIACTINQNDIVPFVRFYCNGELVLPQSTPNATVSSAGGGISVRNPVYCLFPVVAMFSSHAKPRMRVKFNFRGDFRFPLLDFEPYGGDI